MAVEQIPQNDKSARRRYRSDPLSQACYAHLVLWVPHEERITTLPVQKISLYHTS